MRQRKNRIGILGGSFNPPHLGHVGICETVLAQKLVDAVWVIPCFEHPFNKKLVSFEHRFEMCLLAFEEFGSSVRVSDIEKKMGGKSYTLKTVETLQKKYPEQDFVLILGQDAASEAKTWHRYLDLRKALSWVVLPRGPHSPIPDVSAMDIRERLEQGLSVKDVVPGSVVQFIQDHGLWTKD